MAKRDETDTVVKGSTVRGFPALLVTVALGVALLPGAPVVASPLDEVVHSDNMEHVANLRWDDVQRRTDGRSTDAQGGTDVEFATIAGRDYAFAGTYRNGLQVVDITDPAAPVHVATYDCQILQGDVQTFTRVSEATTDDETVDSGPGRGHGRGRGRPDPDPDPGDPVDELRHYVTYTADSGYSHRPSACYEDIGLDGTGRAGDGTLIIDVTDPANPVSVSFVAIPGGSHNQTVHPSGSYLYNSNSGGAGFIEVYDISDLSAPALVTKMPTAGDDSHDLTFNGDGTRAYSAALDHTLIINTEDPRNPVVVSAITDPAVTLHHQTDPVTIGDRDFVIINDELNGAGGNEYCPGGGLHVYDVTDEANPEKVGAFFIPEVTAREGAGTGLQGTVTCTSHVFRIYEEQQLLTIAWFGAGVRVVDLSALGDTPPVSTGVLGQTLTPGMREVGFYRFVEDSDAWSAKVHRFDEDGSAYIFADDQTRGFDVYRFDATAATSENPGTWLSPGEAAARTAQLRADGLIADELLPYCDLRGRQEL